MLSLEAAGIEAICVDAAYEIRPLGVGINVLPHAARELIELGLGDALASSGVPTAALVYHDRFGRPIWTEQRGVAAGYHWPQYSIHRGRLQQLLLDTVRRRVGERAVRCGVAVEDFRTGRTEVCVALRSRHSDTREVVSADVLVGADGINSVVRGKLHPSEGPPIWSGINMWRGTAEREPFLGGRTMIVAGSNLSSKFVAYPISAEAESRGRALVNWVAEAKVAAPGSAPEDWRQRGRHDDFRTRFADWRFDWLDVPALIEATTDIIEFPMVDRNPLRHWGEERVTLLGDAAHPMYPVGSNGASQAILDARVLAWCLAESDDPQVGLRSYEALRRPPTTELVLASRELGPERIMALVEQRTPDGFGRIEDVLNAGELDEIMSRYRQQAGFSVAELNVRPSWTVS
ncbi:flavin-dependent oxidoreductase [Amycolatopsis sp. NPDC049868]|uniref:flavin-dependent oxidoreductase n=1 Tax=Amycolatopsis sp. NPDC049868 TaxID=3363934 RepID=UPI0037BB06A9